MLILLSFLKDNWKWVLGLSVVALAFGAGWTSHKPAEVTKEVVKWQTQVVEVDKKTDKKTTTKVTQSNKDGSSVVTETVNEDIEEDSQQTKTASGTKVAETVAQVTVSQNQYSLGITANYDISDWKNFDPTYEVKAGRRLIGDVWGEVGFDWKASRVSLGIRYEF